MDKKDYMKMALEFAEKGIGAVNPNPLVGAVVVKNGEIVGTGYHKYYGGPHAEVYALEEAGENAVGADVRTLPMTPEKVFMGMDEKYKV